MAGSTTDTKQVCAVLPLKPFGDAKERLATGLDARARRVLAREMARDVLAALRRCESVDAVVVVSSEPEIEELAAGSVDAIVADDRRGHSLAAAAGQRWALEHGFTGALLVPGDCPLLAPAEVDRLVGECAAGAIEVAVVPDRLGTGTNALLLTPPDAIEPAFGPGSHARHLLIAAAEGRRTTTFELPSLALDLDTADDLSELAQAIAAGGHDAVHTEQALGDLLLDRRRLPGGMAR